MDPTTVSIILIATNIMVYTTLIFNRTKSVKQFFCKHIMKDVSQEKTKVTRELVSGYGLPSYRNYQYYSYHYKCIKCGKETTEEHKFLIGESKIKEDKEGRYTN